MPDTSSMNNLMPTPEQYETIVTSLKAQLDEKIVAIEAEEFVSSLEKKRKEAKDSNPAIDNNSTTNDENPNNSDQIVSSDSIVVDATPTHTAEPTSTTNTTTTVPPIPAAAVEAVMNEVKILVVLCDTPKAVYIYLFVFFVKTAVLFFFLPSSKSNYLSFLTKKSPQTQLCFYLTQVLLPL